jgi:hypothetical protein
MKTLSDEQKKKIEKIQRDPVYQYLSNEIGKLSSQIFQNKYMLSKLTNTQIELKRGKAALVKLRREKFSIKKDGE